MQTLRQMAEGYNLTSVSMVQSFLPGRCVRADAAAVLAALLDFESLSTFPAADAAVANW